MPHPPLPTQPADVPWPTRAWPEGPPDASVDAVGLSQALEHGFREPEPQEIGKTHALLAVHRGRLVAERYDAETAPDRAMPSWSMAKSVLQVLVGMLVKEGRLDPSAPVHDPRWPEGDPRNAITLDQMLRMSSGLRFDEEYTDLESSNTIQMLFGPGKDDTAGFAAAMPALHPPGTVWSYSSGTSNIVSALVGRAVGGGEEGMRSFMREALLDRIGMASADPRFDASGTWIGSSFLFATARDFARFGLLCLRDGVWEGERLLPEGWMDYARTPTAGSEEEYGSHFWLARDGTGNFAAMGFRGQYIVMCPSRDLVLVRLGTSMPDQKKGAFLWMKRLVECFPVT